MKRKLMTAIAVLSLVSVAACSGKQKRPDSDEAAGTQDSSQVSESPGMTESETHDQAGVIEDEGMADESDASGSIGTESTDSPGMSGSESSDSVGMTPESSTESLDTTGDAAGTMGEESASSTSSSDINKTIRQSSIPTVDQAGTVADINQMSAEQFEKLGFSEQAAQNIVSAREQVGRFDNVEALNQVAGVDPSTVSRLSDHLGVSQEQQAGQEAMGSEVSAESSSDMDSSDSAMTE